MVARKKSLSEQKIVMAHIKLPENVPGIRGPMLISPALEGSRG